MHAPRDSILSSFVNRSFTEYLPLSVDLKSVPTTKVTRQMFTCERALLLLLRHSAAERKEHSFMYDMTASIFPRQFYREWIRIRVNSII